MKALTYSVLLLGSAASASAAFEGEITAELTRGGETRALLYVVSADHVRIEVTGTDWPHPINLVGRQSGEITLIFPHNHGVMRLRPADGNAAPDAELRTSPPPGGLPAGIGPQSGNASMPAVLLAGIGPTNPPGMPTFAAPQMPHAPALPAGIGPGYPGGMPSPPLMPFPGESMELTVTGETTNRSGYSCTRYEIKQHGAIMEIWATDALMPFHSYLQTQPLSFGPRMIEEQWIELCRTRKLFPLLAVLRSENGTERLRFEVKSIARERIDDRDGRLFQPPADYQELRPPVF